MHHGPDGSHHSLVVLSPCLYGQLFLWNYLVTLLLYISGRDILFGQLSQWHFCGGFVGWSYRTLPTLAWCCTYHPLQDCGIVNLIITGNLNAMTLTNNPNINPNIKIVSGLDVLHLLGHWPVTDYLYLSLIHSKAIRADDKTQKVCCVDAKGTLFNFSI